MDRAQAGTDVKAASPQSLESGRSLGMSKYSLIFEGAVPVWLIQG